MRTAVTCGLSVLVLSVIHGTHKRCHYIKSHHRQHHTCSGIPRGCPCYYIHPLGGDGDAHTTGRSLNCALGCLNVKNVEVFHLDFSNLAQLGTVN